MDSEEEDDVLPGESPVATDVQVQEPDMSSLHSRLSASLDEVRAQGRGALISQRALRTAISNNTTPAARIADPQKENPGPDVAGLINRAPVTAKKLATSPGAAAAFGSNDETLKILADAEQAYAGTYAQIEQTKKNTEEVISQQDATVGNFFNSVFAGWYQSRMNAIGSRMVLGTSTAQDEIDLKDYQEKYDKLLKTSTAPKVLGTTGGMLEPMAEQALTGVGAAAPFAVAAIAGAPETGGLSLAALAPAATAFHVGMSARMGYDAMGGAFLNFRQMKGADGEPIRPEVAKGGAIAVGVATGLAAEVGLKYIGGGLKAIVNKLGGGKVGQIALEQLIGKAVQNPAFNSALIKIGASATKTAAVNSAFAFINQLAEGVAEEGMSLAQPSLGFPAPSDILKRALDDATSVESTIAPGFLLGLGLAGAVKGGGVLLDKTARAAAFQEHGVPIVWEFSQGEARENPERTKEILHAIEETNGSPDVHSTVSVPPERVRQMQTEDMSGRSFASATERRLQKAEQTGQEFVSPTADYAAEVKTQPGADRLVGHERFGDMITPAEQQELTKSLKKVLEKDPVEEETKKVAKDMEVKFTAGGELPIRAKAHAAMWSESVRVAALEKARSLGVEPTVFEDYQKVGPIEVAGGRENAAVAFEKKFAAIVSEARTEARREGTGTSKTEKKAAQGKGPPKAPLERLQEAVSSTLGETFPAYRVEGKARAGGGLEAGVAYLRAEDALKFTGKDQEVVPVYVRPTDVTGAQKGVITTLPLDAERVVPHTQEEVRQYHTKAGQKAQEKQAREGRTLGWIDTNKSFSQITRTGIADMSTFAHEMGHYVEKVWETLAPERLREINKWRGVEPGAKPTVEQGEMFARAIEQFIRDGTPPNKGMIDTFQTLTRYMKSAYGAAGPLVELDPEARRAIERLFALSEEVDDGLKALGLDQDVFASETSSLSKEEMLKGRELMADAKRQAYSKGFEASGKVTKAATVGKEIQEYRAWAANDVASSDINNIYNWLKTGSTLDGRDMGLEHQKLRYDDVRMEGFDPEDFRGLLEPKNKPEAGHSPDVLAAVMGTGETGRELLERLRRVDDFKTQAEEKAQEYFNKNHPGWTDMGDYARAQGLLAIHNKALEKLYLFRDKVLGKMLRMEGDEKAIKYSLDQTVRDYMQDITAKEIKPSTAFRAEVKAQAEMRKAFGKGDYEGARDWNRKAYLNKLLFEKLSDSKENLTATVKDMEHIANDTARRARIARGGPEYLSIIDHLLTPLGFLETPPGMDIAQVAGLKPGAPESLRMALKVLEDRGEPFPLDLQFSEPGGMKSWQQMEYPVLMEAFAAVQAAEHLAKQRGLVLFSGKMRELEEIDTQLGKHIEDSALKKGGEKHFKKVTDLSRPDDESAKPGIRKKISASLSRPEQMIRWWDRGEQNGLVDREINQPIQKALGELEKKGERVHKALDEYLRKDLEPGELHQEVELPNGQTRELRSVLMMLAYFGDSRNWEQMVKGEDPNWTYKQAKGWFQGLVDKGVIQEKHIEKINNLVDLTGSFWEDVRATKEKETGLKIEPVAGKPEVWTLPDGRTVTQKGGYVPTSYDYERGGMARPVDDGISLFSPAQVRAGLPNSFTLERTPTGLNVPLDYDLQNIGRHLEDVIRYTTMYDSLTRAQKLSEGPNFRKAIIEYYGKPEYDQIQPFLKALARNSGSEIPQGLRAISKTMGVLKYGTNLKLFGWKFGMSLQQFTGMAASIPDVGVHNLAYGMLKAFDPAERARVDAISSEVKNSLHMLEAAAPESAIGQIFKEFSNKPLTRSEAHVQKFIRKTGYIFIKWVTRQSSMVNYLAGEARAKEILTERMAKDLNEGRDPIKPGSQEWDDTVKHIADQTVRFADSSSAFKDLPQWFRDNKWAWSFMNLAAGYSNNLFNHIKNSGYNFKRGEYAKAMGEFMWVVAAPALIGGFIGRQIFPKFSQGRWEKDDLKWGAWNSLAQVLAQVLRTVPIGGELTADAIKHVLDKSPVKDKIDFFGRTPLTLPFIDSVERFSDHIGNYWSRTDKGSLQGNEAEKLTLDVIDLAAQIGVPGIGQFPAQGPTNAWKMYQNIQHKRLKYNDAETFKMLLAPGQPYQGKKK